MFEGFIVDGKFRRFFEQSEDEQVPEVYHIVECSVEVLEDELSNLVLVIYVRIDQVSPLREIEFEKCVFLLGDAVEIIWLWADLGLDITEVKAIRLLMIHQVLNIQIGN